MMLSGGPIFASLLLVQAAAGSFGVYWPAMNTILISVDPRVDLLRHTHQKRCLRVGELSNVANTRCSLLQLQVGMDSIPFGFVYIRLMSSIIMYFGAPYVKTNRF